MSKILLISQNHSILSRVRNMNISRLTDVPLLVQVPEVMYQVYFDMAMMNPDKETVKRRIFEDLQNWIKEQYPGYGLAAFQDYSIDEANDISQKTGYPITWGMWLLLQQGSQMEQVDLSQKLLSAPLKQIEK